MGLASPPAVDSFLGISQRNVPSNQQAEQSLLGALLANNKSYDRVCDFLLPEHFIDPVNGRVYSAIARRIEAGAFVDAIVLKTEFENSGILDEVGGTAYLSALLTAMVGIINAGEYGAAIYQAWQRRQMIEIGEKLVHVGFGTGPEAEPLKIATACAGELDFLAAGRSGRRNRSFAEAMEDAVRQGEASFDRGGCLGRRTGFLALDWKLSGISPGDLIVVGGRPGMGKTAAASGLACGVARSERLPVFIWEGEMSAEQLGHRQLSEATGIPLHDIRSGAWLRPDAPVEWTRKIGNAVALARDLPIEICDEAGLTVSQIGMRARAYKRRNGGRLGAVVLDYLQIIRSESKEGKVQQVTEISNALKRMAKELECPVIALSQLSRQVESRENKRPVLSDLRESGAIEQDADVIMFLYRHEYYIEQAKPTRGIDDTDTDYAEAIAGWEQAMSACSGAAEWIIAKNRHGSTGTIPMLWDATHTCFREPAIL